MTPHDIIIGGIRIAFDSAYELTQTYDNLGGVALHRMLDGTGVQQVHWRKLATTITGSGKLPDGLAALNFDSSITILCMAPLGISTVSNVITLPAARRTDWAPVGYAIVGGRLVRSAVSVSTNTATVTTVSGATAYQVLYWPSLTVLASPPERQFNGRGTVAGWTLRAEEV